jgi:CHAD domain-containing protein
MNQEEIKHITDTHYKKLKKHIKQVTKDFDIEAIHQLRVQYKKLRALLRMLPQQKGSALGIKITKKLKTGYNISGAIRDLQLQQQRILEVTKDDLKKPCAYITLIQKETDKLKKELSEIFLEKPVNECKKKTDVFVPEKFPLNSFRNFILQKWAAIYEIIISGNFNDDNIHTIRKNLKDLFYNLKIYEGIEHDIILLSIWKGKDENYINELLDELGKFQDKCVSIALLKSSWINSLNTSNREQLRRIKVAWIKDKLITKKLLVEKLKTDIIPQQVEP